MAFINYNGTQLDQSAFLQNAANEVNMYVNSQPWSSKRKHKFMEAYQDIMNHGVLGASIGPEGIWNINHNGVIDQSGMSKMDRQMYGEAAYFIQQQMHYLGTSSAKKEEDTKKDLVAFNNFQNNFGDFVSNNKFGGREIQLNDVWTPLDERDTTTGLRGNTKRIETLKNWLAEYRDSLENNKYNFEGSAFKDLDDLKTRINNAIEGLNNGDINAINQIGLNPKEWFYNGSSDIAGVDKDGNQITYAQLAQQKQALADAKAKEELAKKQAQIRANSGVKHTFSGIHGTDARTNPQAYSEYLANKFGVGEQGFNAINTRVQELIDKAYSTKTLNNAEKKELGNLLYYIRKNNPNYNSGQNLSDQEWAELNRHQLSDTNRDNYIHLPWKTSDGRNIYADGQGNLHILKNTNNAQLPSAFKRSQQAINYRNNFLKSTNTAAANAAYFNEASGFSAADQRELGSIFLDLAAAVDPEGLSSGIIANAASGLRDYNRATDKDGMTLRDYGHAALDHVLASISFLPFVGGWGAGTKSLARLAKYAPKVEQYFRYIARGMATGAMASSASGALEAWNKIDFNDLSGSAKRLSVNDWRNLATFFLGGLGHHQLNRTNLAERTALQGRGMETSNTFGNRLGFTRTKPNQKSQDYVKIKTEDGTTHEIPVSSKTKEELEKSFVKKGNNAEERSKIVRENSEVKSAAESEGISKEQFEKASVIYENNFRNNTN